MGKTPEILDNLIEQVCESFDNAYMNEDKEVEKWFNDGGELTLKFTCGGTTIKTKEVK